MISKLSKNNLFIKNIFLKFYDFELYFILTNLSVVILSLVGESSKESQAWYLHWILKKKMHNLERNILCVTSSHHLKHINCEILPFFKKNLNCKPYKSLNFPFPSPSQIILKKIFLIFHNVLNFISFWYLWMIKLINQFFKLKKYIF